MSTILIVDDDSTLLLCLAEVLERARYTVVARSNAAAALETARTGTQIDLIITDYRMVGMDGIEFLHQMRHLHPHLPALVLTGYATLDGFLKAKGLGAVQFLEKPVPVRELLRTVDTVLATRTGTISAGGAGSVRGCSTV